MLPCNQIRIIERVKFKHSLLCKAFEEQIKTIENLGMKQVEALKAVKLEENQEVESIEGNFSE